MKSKMESLCEKIEEIQPTIICITETHLLKEENVEIDDYVSLRNDRNSSGGGVLIAVRKELKNICTIVEKKKEIEESLWVTVDNTRVKLRIGLIYSPQESRTTVDMQKEMYKSIEEQISIGKERNQNILLLGDFNCKIGDAINGNTKEVTKGGKLLLDMAKTNKLVILNTTPTCHGTWTREEGKSKSVLDYILINQENLAGFERMDIDQTKEFAPRGMGKSGYSDHNVITASFNWILIEKENAMLKRKIITTKGYAKVAKELKENCVSSILFSGENIQVGYENWKRKVEEIKERNSTTVKQRNPRKKIKELVRTKRRLKELAKKSSSRTNCIQKIKMVNEKIEEERGMQFKNKIDKVVERLRSKHGINGPNMWKVVQSVKRKKDEPATAIKDKEGNILEEPEKIKERYLEHFSEILKPVEAVSEEEKLQEELINIAFKNIMEKAKQQSTYLTKDEEVEIAVKELKRKKCKDAGGWVNELLIFGGDEMLKSLRILFNRMETERKTPKEWSEVMIKTISKPGSVLEMNNKRGLFITEVVSKVYEKILKNRNEAKISSYISEFQTGGRKGTSTVDNHIILSEIIRKNRKMGKKTYIVYGDAVKCFDKLWLKDSLVELFNAGCSPQDIQMIHLLNKDTEVTVVTPSGATKKLKVGEVVKQGTVLGPTLCCVVTDQVNNMGEEQTGSIGNQRIGILVFVDDVMSAGAADDARCCIRNLGEMERKKKFTFGLKKTNYMVIDTGKELEEEIDEKVKGGKVSKTEEYKYVGLWISKKGDCALHISKKAKQIKGEVVALKSIANYYNTGGAFVNVRLELYESCIVHSLLYNLEGWNKITKTELKSLEQVQFSTLCSLLQLPKTTPYIGLLNEIGIWRIEEKLMYRKIMLYHNLHNSPDSRLAKRIVEEQQHMEEKDTFYSDVEEMATVLRIQMETIRLISKSQLKKLVKDQINERMSQLVKKKSLTMKKMRFVKEEADEFGRKMYLVKMTGAEAMKTLKIRLNMIPIYGNFRGDVYLRRRCVHCGESDDTTEHLISCKVFGNNHFTSSHLQNDQNIELWKQINELVDTNLHLRRDNPEEGQFRYFKKRSPKGIRCRNKQDLEGNLEKNPEKTVQIPEGNLA